jgi:tetratricopeptide (TPR) repeat protein
LEFTPERLLFCWRKALFCYAGGMSIFLPFLVIGILVGTAWAADAPPVRTLEESPVAPSTTADGLGAYLRGAVADVGGSTDNALQGYLAALTEDPDNLDLRQRTFELALMTGDIPTAVRLARSLPAVRQTTMSRLTQVVALAHEGKVAEARKLARDVVKVSPDLLQFRLLTAYLDYADGGRVEKLIAWLDAAPLPAPLEGRRAYHEARLWLKAGQPAKALALLRLAHKAEPTAVGTTLLLGRVLVQQGEPGEAAALYDVFRERNPAIGMLVPTGTGLLAEPLTPFASTLDDDLSATLLDFGLLVWAQGALGPSRQVMNMALWLNPHDIHTRYYTALLLEMAGDNAAAAQQYALLTGTETLAPVRLAAQLRLAEITFRNGDRDGAWRTVRNLARANPGVPTLQRSLAQMAFDRGAFDVAAQAYTALLDTAPAKASQPLRVDLLFARGATLERGGKRDAAARDLQLALALDPTNAQVMNYLGYMWVEQGINTVEAFKLLQRAHLLAPADGAITDSLGWAYYKQGDYATAVTYLGRAAEQDPESAEIIDHLGDAYAKLGKPADARAQWQKALDLLAEGAEEPQKGFKKAVQRKLR